MSLLFCVWADQQEKEEEEQEEEDDKEEKEEKEEKDERKRDIDEGNTESPTGIPNGQEESGGSQEKQTFSVGFATWAEDFRSSSEPQSRPRIGPKSRIHQRSTETEQLHDEQHALTAGQQLLPEALPPALRPRIGPKSRVRRVEVDESPPGLEAKHGHVVVPSAAPSLGTDLDSCQTTAAGESQLPEGDSCTTTAAGESQLPEGDRCATTAAGESQLPEGDRCATTATGESQLPECDSCTTTAAGESQLPECVSPADRDGLGTAVPGPRPLRGSKRMANKEVGVHQNVKKPTRISQRNRKRKLPDRDPKEASEHTAKHASDLEPKEVTDLRHRSRDSKNSAKTADWQSADGDALLRSIIIKSEPEEPPADGLCLVGASFSLATATTDPFATDDVSGPSSPLVIKSEYGGTFIKREADLDIEEWATEEVITPDLTVINNTTSDMFSIDPLEDPLGAFERLAAVRPFAWPPLDPLFRTQIDFHLPKVGFAAFLRTRAKPTAEIPPLVHETATAVRHESPMTVSTDECLKIAGSQPTELGQLVHAVVGPYHDDRKSLQSAPQFGSQVMGKATLPRRSARQRVRPDYEEQPEPESYGGGSSMAHLFRSPITTAAAVKSAAAAAAGSQGGAVLSDIYKLPVFSSGEVSIVRLTPSAGQKNGSRKRQRRSRPPEPALPPPISVLTRPADSSPGGIPSATNAIRLFWQAKGEPLPPPHLQTPHANLSSLPQSKTGVANSDLQLTPTPDSLHVHKPPDGSLTRRGAKRRPQSSGYRSKSFASGSQNTSMEEEGPGGGNGMSSLVAAQRGCQRKTSTKAGASRRERRSRRRPTAGRLLVVAASGLSSCSSASGVTEGSSSNGVPIISTETAAAADEEHPSNRGSASNTRVTSAPRKKIVKRRPEGITKAERYSVRPSADAEVKSPAKRISAATAARDDSSAVASGHKVICKTGDYVCPLCGLRFRLNQTYGGHVRAKECRILPREEEDVAPEDMDRVRENECVSAQDQKEEEEALNILMQRISKPKINFVSVVASTPTEDSYVVSSLVPSLRALSRFQCDEETTLERVAVSVKEGLEYYHTMVWPSNTGPVALRHLARLTRVPFAASVRAYTALCRDPLKIALYFEKKIATARLKSHRERTTAWLAKYRFFLRLPIHDIFLYLVDSAYKVVEYCAATADAADSIVKIICLNCPRMECRGCPLKKLLAAASASKHGGYSRKAAAIAKPRARKTLKVTLKLKRPVAVSPFSRGEGSTGTGTSSSGAVMSQTGQPSSAFRRPVSPPSGGREKRKSYLAAQAAIQTVSEILHFVEEEDGDTGNDDNDVDFRTHRRRSGGEMPPCGDCVRCRAANCGDCPPCRAAENSVEQHAGAYAPSSRQLCLRRQCLVASGRMRKIGPARPGAVSSSSSSSHTQQSAAKLLTKRLKIPVTMKPSSGTTKSSSTITFANKEQLMAFLSRQSTAGVSGLSSAQKPMRLADQTGSVAIRPPTSLLPRNPFLVVSQPAVGSGADKGGQPSVPASAEANKAAVLGRRPAAASSACDRPQLFPCKLCPVRLHSRRSLIRHRSTCHPKTAAASAAQSQ